MTTRSVSLRKSELEQLLSLKGDSFNLSGFVREAIRRELDRERLASQDPHLKRSE